MLRYLLLLLLLPVLAHAEDFLEPEQAFRFSAKALDAQTLEASWKIADGYYLYRDKFKFKLEGATLDTPLLPKGDLKQDETFGNVEVYHKAAAIRLPVRRTPGGALPVTLTATFQGCAAGGICYMPTSQTINLTLPASSAAPGKATVSPLPAPPALTADPIASLQTLAADDGSSPDFLPPEQAFKAQAQREGNDRISVRYTVAPDYYLYRDKLQFKILAPAGLTITETRTPAPDVKEDPNFGRTEVYHKDFTATLSLSRPLAGSEALTLALTYQGCSEKGICYPPQEQTVTLADGASAATPSDGVAGLFAGGSFWLIIAGFFGFGLLLSLTPCVFPMIPILSGIIAGQKQLTKTSGLTLAAAYVLGMALTYTIAGVIAGLSGSLLSAALQNPWVLGSFALIFVLLSFSMFGFYDLQLPSSLQSRMSNASNRIKGGNFIGVFVMGALSAVIVGPCVAAPLAGALLYIGQTGDVWLGGSALFAMALGMGVPLLLVGLAGGALLPRAGAWMDAVKGFFGVLLLGVALWLVSPFLPAWLLMLGSAALLIIPAAYLRAFDPLPTAATGWAKLWKGIGVMAAIAGLALLIGLLAGGRDLLQPLSIFRGGATTPATSTHALPFERIRSVSELDRRLTQAQSAGQAVMLDFYADWCISCKEMEKFTFSDPAVQGALQGVLFLQADVTANNEADRELLKRFGLFGPPGIIFWDKTGTQSPHTVIGFEKPEAFLASVKRALP